MKNAVFSNVTPCILVEIYRRFSTTSENFYQTTRCHLTEDIIFNTPYWLRLQRIIRQVQLHANTTWLPTYTYKYL